MNKSTKYLLGFALFLFGMLMYLESTAEKPLDLRPYYTSNSKKPLGSKAFFDLFENAKPDAELIDLKETLFTFDRKNSIQSGSMLFFNNYVDFDAQSFEILTKYVRDGNDVLISSNFFPKIFQDSLKIKTLYILEYDKLSYDSKVVLSNKTSEAIPPMEWDMNYFEVNENNYEALGHVHVTHDNKDKEKEKQPNLLRIPMDKGNLYVHSFPEAFSNLFLLHEKNHVYTEDLLNLLDLNHSIYLDKYNKSGNEQIQSLVHYITEQPALNLAYKSLLFLSILLVIFESKRKQRSIPVITPLANKTYEFAQTVALMYLDKKEYKQLAEKEIFQFLDFIRNQLKIDTKIINDSFFNELSTKLGKKTEDVRKTFELIKSTQNKETISKEEMYELHQLIEFLKQ